MMENSRPLEAIRADILGIIAMGVTDDGKENFGLVKALGDHQAELHPHRKIRTKSRLFGEDPPDRDGPLTQLAHETFALAAGGIAMLYPFIHR